MRTVAGVFPSEFEAARTGSELKALGISADEIIVAGSDGQCLSKGLQLDRNISAAAASGAGWLLAGAVRAVASSCSSRVGVTVGAAVGAGMGAIGGLVVHATTTSPFAHVSGFLVVPGAMALGAVAGGLLAWVYSLGVSHERVAFCAEAAREHGVVVAAHVSEAIEPAVMRVMKEHGAAKLRSEVDPWRASGWTGRHPEDQQYPSDSSVKWHAMHG